MVTFEILLPSVHIQPAQALVCYDCTDIHDICTAAVSEKTKKITCPSNWPFCVDFEIQEDGATNFVRGCANHKHVAEYNFM
ncbi:hypothetical protein Ocin01_19162 [Orchesella cincta]|uniref:Uncharacterized protein n=1 Tax=Orchesella cincta TaxID=48709 RepID=A0A1D2M3L0_ORCCI|nr:hypothetical protein Ocin01_19162 [Orchesella cincta]